MYIYINLIVFINHRRGLFKSLYDLHSNVLYRHKLIDRTKKWAPHHWPL